MKAEWSDGVLILTHSGVSFRVLPEDLTKLRLALAFPEAWCKEAQALAGSEFPIRADIARQLIP